MSLSHYNNVQKQYESAFRVSVIINIWFSERILVCLDKRDFKDLKYKKGIWLFRNEKKPESLLLLNSQKN